MANQAEQMAGNATARVIEVSGDILVTRSDGLEKILQPGMPLFENDHIETSSSQASLVLSHADGQFELNGPFSHSIGSTLQTPNEASAEAQILAAKEDSQDIEEFDPNVLEAPSAGEAGFNEPQNGLSRPPLIADLSELDEVLARHSHTNTTIAFEQADNPLPSSNTATPEDNALLAFENSLQTDDAIRLQHINLGEDATIIGGSDSFDTSLASQQLDTQYGLLFVNGKGDWQYQLNNTLDTVQQLGAGDTLTEVIRFTAQDNHTYQIQVTIHGNNDAANITGDRSGEVTEDGSHHLVEGKLDISDVDLGEARFQTLQNLETTYGHVSIDGRGNWQYTLDQDASAVQSLREGDQVFDSFSATSLDGSHEVIRITINGSNDAPLFTGSNQSTVYLEDDVETSGRLLIHDADFGESTFIEEHLIGKYGTGSIDAQGHWHYEVDSSHEAVGNLPESARLYDQLLVSTADGTSQHLIVTIEAGSAPGQTSLTAQPVDDDMALANTEALSTESNSASELYIWKAPENNADTESIRSFQPGQEGDKLIIDDLLISQPAGQEDAEILGAYLDFEVTRDGTTLHISPEGLQSTTRHDIVLEGFDASQLGQSNSEIIQSLMQSGNLEIAGLA